MKKKIEKKMMMENKYGFPCWVKFDYLGMDFDEVWECFIEKFPDLEKDIEAKDKFKYIVYTYNESKMEESIKDYLQLHPSLKVYRRNDECRWNIILKGTIGDNRVIK